VAKKSPVRLVASAVKHRCSLLAIDPGKTSGWSLYLNGDLKHCGQCQTAVERHQAIETALVFDNKASPLVVVMETWSAGGWASHKVMFGMGASRGRWLEQLDLAAIPKSRIVSVLPQRWRKDIFGRGMGKPSRDQFKEMAQTIVHLKHHIHVPHDIAEAILIGEWGTKSLEVGEAIPKRFRSNDRKLMLVPAQKAAQENVGSMD